MPFYCCRGRVDPGLNGRYISKLAMPSNTEPRHVYFCTAARGPSPLICAPTIV